MIIKDCEFSNPYYFDLATKTLMPFDGGANSDWGYKSLDCTSTDSTLDLIQNSETGAEFYVDKTLNYGDALLLWFLTMFLIGVLFKFAYNFFWKK